MIILIVEKNKIFWIGCFPPSCHSIGDHAQTLAIQKFLEKEFTDYEIKRFYRDEVDRFFKEAVKENDLIFIHSGGDFGDLHPEFHTIRKRIIRTFPKNCIVQLPVSVYYQSQATFEADKIFFSGRKNLLLLCRTPENAKLLSHNFGCRVEFFPDFAFYLKPNFPDVERKGVLGVFRYDTESKFRKTIPKRIQRRPFKRFSNFMCDIQQEKRMHRLFNHCFLSDVQISDVDITDENRERIVFDCLRIYKGFTKVLTDRFHACVFSYLTDTPFLAFQSKIPEKTCVYPFLDYCSYFKGFRDLIFSFSQEEKCENFSGESTGEVFDVILSRRSVRKWKSKSIEPKKIRQILESGVYAPSAANIQVTKFKVLLEPNQIKFVCNHTSPWFQRSFPNRVILVFYDTSKLPRETWTERFIWQDTACAMQNMMLVAESLGIKSCWASVNPEQEIDIKKFFEIPKKFVLACMLFLGYSDIQVSLRGRHQGRQIARNLEGAVIQ